MTATPTRAGRTAWKTATAGERAQQRAERRVHRGDHVDLPRGGARQPDRREARLAAGGGQPRGRADEDEQREDQADGGDAEAVLVEGRGVVRARGGGDGVDGHGAGHGGQLAGGPADDDDQVVRAGQRRPPDQPGAVAGEAAGELFARHGVHQLGERGRDVVAPRAGQLGDAGHGRCGRSVEDGDVEPLDRAARVGVLAVVPQHGARGGAQRPAARRGAGRALPARAVSGHLEGVEQRHRGQQHRHPPSRRRR
ncbi:hypothetical protein ACFSTC_13315 [Nonomuraea ferruginea]